MACFSNVFESPEVPLKILDRLILKKEHALIDIIKHVYKSMKQELLRYQVRQNGHGRHNDMDVSLDGSQLQAYLARHIYLHAHERDLFFPPLFEEDQ